MWPASAGGGPDTHRLPSRVNVFELDISHSEIKCKEKLSRKCGVLSSLLSL